MSSGLLIIIIVIIIVFKLLPFEIFLSQLGQRLLRCSEILLCVDNNSDEPIRNFWLLGVFVR